MKLPGSVASRLMLCMLTLVLHGCNWSSGWKTEHYRDDHSGIETLVAKKRFKQDSMEIGSAVKCVLPRQLSFEFTTEGAFKTANVGGANVIGYELGLNSKPPVAMNALFSSPDTLTLPRLLPAGPGAPPIDLGKTTQLLFQLFVDQGTTTVILNPGDAGLADVFKACGVDPEEVAAAAAQQINGSAAIQKPVIPLTGQPVVKTVNLATLSAQWNCSGDLGDFTFTIDNYRYQFSDDSPWSSVSGRISIGQHQQGMDNSAAFPINFEDGPWDQEDSPWSYSSLGPGGIIYYVATDTGQSAQCVRATS